MILALRRWYVPFSARAFRGIICVAATLSTLADRAEARPDPSRLAALRVLDMRVEAIGYRLALANAATCRRTPLSGFGVHMLSQYGAQNRVEAARAFALERGPSILAVAPGGVADRAGLRPDDRLIAIDGLYFPEVEPNKASGDYVATARAVAMIESAIADGQADVIITRAGQPRSAKLNAAYGCATRFQVVPSKRLTATADGRYVQVTSALVDYAADDDELAAILAHELAHNVLEHRAKLDDARVSRGLLRHFGGSARKIRETEVEADRLSVTLLLDAGYDPAAAGRFWRRFGRQHGKGLFASATHPGWKRRIALIEAETARLIALRDGVRARRDEQAGTTY